MVFGAVAPEDEPEIALRALQEGLTAHSTQQQCPEAAHGSEEAHDAGAQGAGHDFRPPKLLRLAANSMFYGENQ